MTVSGTTTPQLPARPAKARSHDRRRVAYEPGFSMLRTSLGMRLAIVAGCSVVLWGAVWLVLA